MKIHISNTFFNDLTTGKSNAYNEEVLALQARDILVGTLDAGGNLTLVLVARQRRVGQYLPFLCN